jgi:SRSO17 transposase
MDADQIRSLQPALVSFLNGFRPCFRKEVTFEHFQCYLLGLMADLRRKSVEPIALAAGVPVRTLQEFLSLFAWDHDRLDRMVLQRVANRSGPTEGGIGIIDATGHPKRGDKTPGVQRQYCGQTGKLDNCVVAQHLLYTDDKDDNPFCCALASDLYLPRVWSEDRERCRGASIPNGLEYRPKWKIALEQVERARGAGVKLAWVVFDEEYGVVPAFWFALDRLGQPAVGEVPCNFRCWTRRPACASVQRCHAARRADNLIAHSPSFTSQAWTRCVVKTMTRGHSVWEYKAARVHLTDSSNPNHNIAVPTDRMYWLLAARNTQTDEVKYVVSNASEQTRPEVLLRVLLSRWHVEKWFERAKQEAGLGAFEVRTYTSLVRHWLCVRVAMAFLAEQTARLRGEKSEDHIRASERGVQHAGRETLAPELALMG